MEKQYKYAKSVIERMSKTIEDFRNFFNPTKAKDDFLLNDVINEVLSILEGSLSKANVHVNIKVDKTINVFGYKNELSQAILNIINNAQDALKDTNSNHRVIKIGAYSKNNFAHISISDNAGGIKDEVIDKVFEPYFTTKHAGSGTGLGLYIVKIIIENSMKGEVSVENKNGGANFEIKIPIK
jgi:C4-dicarboxylate-specific signal transduction histidine kinase